MAPTLLGLSIYLWIALISLLFLVVLALTGSYGLDVGHDVDVGGGVDHDFGQFSGSGISPLSPPLVAAFGTTFGAVGALLDLQGFSEIATAFLAAVSAAALAFGLFYFVQRYLVRSQASSDVQPEALVGQDAHVMIPIRPGTQGQILILTPERGRTLFPAVSQEDIPRDAVVQILGFAGGVANVRKKLG